MRADDLVVLLEVARSGSLNTAARVLGLTHSTLSRRLDVLEVAVGAPVVSRSTTGCQLTDLGRSLLPAAEAVERAVATARHPAAGGDGQELTGLVRVSAPEAFSACFAAPALARLRAQHPRVTVELTATTRPIVHGSGVDVEVGVGDALSPRVRTVDLATYSLGLFASSEYLDRAGRPHQLADLERHALIYYVEGALRVSDLQLVDRLFATHAVELGSTSVFAQVEAARAGGGIALLPTFLARRSSSLEPVLARRVRVELKFVAALAPASFRRAPAVAALAEIRTEVQRRATELA
ncbi:LysR family transcriptional regulator [Nocardioides sp. IC4_145]|uniref:LysR family transcriptional regulator n=1 Tax=Nocardioides sp. IC4_145 TaxID=2714037 RepID=UPI0014098856|nr:LysR family transcriptional regulator [Nocardioides sp. IC4_145]NHC21908.1 LysR family transcriptional regulator [Nocardioides sp. IC4_145]